MGVTIDQVTSGAVSLHLVVTPRFDESNQPTGLCIPKINECDVARDTLQVKCVFDWFLTTNMATAPTTLSGVCDYLMIVTVN